MNTALRVLLPGGGALLVLAAAAVLVCPGGQCGVPAFDASGLAAVNAWRAAWLDRFAAGITWLGSLYVLLPAAVLLAWREARRRGWPLASFLPVALLSAAALGHVAKVLVLRPRPELFPPLTAMPADASFPSAHAMQVTALALAWLLRPGTQATPFAWLVGSGLVTVVALSRVHLQVHFPSDVLAGIGASALLVLALRGLPAWNGARP